MNKRNLLSIACMGLAFLGLSSMAVAQDATMPTPSTSSSSGIDPNYLLMGAALLQVVILLSLNSVMRLLGGSGKAWTDRARRTTSAVLVLLLVTSCLDAQAAPGPTQWTSNQLFYVLVLVNVFLFILILAQVNLLRSVTRFLVGKPEDEVAAVGVKRQSAESKLMQMLTRRVSIEKEQDVLQHHDYDGIRELDNALPPWWLWLFYGTIIWGVVYLVNVHVTGVWPDQKTEYEQEMAQAKADVAAYVAKLGASVDENSVTLLTDASAIGTGKGIYEANCIACHGPAAEGKAGLGPNLPLIPKLGWRESFIGLPFIFHMSGNTTTNANTMYYIGKTTTIFYAPGSKERPAFRLLMQPCVASTRLEPCTTACA